MSEKCVIIIRFNHPFFWENAFLGFAVILVWGTDDVLWLYS